MQAKLRFRVLQKDNQGIQGIRGIRGIQQIFLEPFKKTLGVQPGGRIKKQRGNGKISTGALQPCGHGKKPRQN